MRKSSLFFCSSVRRAIASPWIVSFQLSGSIPAALSCAANRSARSEPHSKSSPFSSHHWLTWYDLLVKSRFLLRWFNTQGLGVMCSFTVAFCGAWWTFYRLRCFTSGASVAFHRNRLTSRRPNILLCDRFSFIVLEALPRTSNTYELCKQTLFFLSCDYQ